jgi:hypothetical protein
MGAAGFAKAIAGGGLAALVFAIAQQPFSRLESASDEHVANETAQQGMAWTSEAFHQFPLIVGAVTVLGVIALAAFQRQGGV